MRYAVPVMLLILQLSGCGPSTLSPESPGPDKQFEGTVSGAIQGAGAGMVTGFQLTSATGPGAAVGAGFGAAIGAIRGAVQDQAEEVTIEQRRELERQSWRAYGQKVVREQYQRRIELHPSRDLYPADIFFHADSANLTYEALWVIHEIAVVQKQYLNWSRLAVAAYVHSTDPESHFANSLAERRSENLVNEFARNGLDPRRLVARGIVVDAPVLIDPKDDKFRYNQAIEFILLDK